MKLKYLFPCAVILISFVSVITYNEGHYDILFQSIVNAILFYLVFYIYRIALNLIEYLSYERLTEDEYQDKYKGHEAVCAYCEENILSEMVSRCTGWLCEGSWCDEAMEDFAEENILFIPEGKWRQFKFFINYITKTNY